MKKITSDDIHFKKMFMFNGQNNSAILVGTKVIGALIERSGSLLKPIETIYQMYTERKYVDDTCWKIIHSEDGEKYVLVQFYNIEKFVNFYNKVELLKNG